MLIHLIKDEEQKERVASAMNELSPKVWSLLYDSVNLIKGRCFNRPEELGDVEDDLFLKSFMDEVMVKLGFNESENIKVESQFGIATKEEI